MLVGSGCSVAGHHGLAHTFENERDRRMTVNDHFLHLLRTQTKDAIIALFAGALCSTGAGWLPLLPIL
jgi:Fe2+ transport system protein B